MGSAINCSFISAHFLLNPYFHTVQTYKRMRLITQVCGILTQPCILDNGGVITEILPSPGTYNPYTNSALTVLVILP